MKAILTLLAVSMLLAGVTAVNAQDDAVNLTDVVNLTTVDENNTTQPIVLDENATQAVAEAASADQGLDVISTSTLAGSSAETTTLDLSTASSGKAVLDLSTLGKKKAMSNVNVLALGGSKPIVYTPSFSIRNNNSSEMSSTIAPTVYTLPVAIGSNATTVYTPPFSISNTA